MTKKLIHPFIQKLNDLMEDTKTPCIYYPREKEDWEIEAEKKWGNYDDPWKDEFKPQG